MSARPAIPTPTDAPPPRDAARATTGNASEMSGHVAVGSSQALATPTNARHNPSRAVESHAGAARHIVSPTWIATNASGTATASHGSASCDAPSTASTGTAIATASRSCGSCWRRRLKRVLSQARLAASGADSLRTCSAGANEPPAGVGSAFEAAVAALATLAALAGLAARFAEAVVEDIRGVAAELVAVRVEMVFTLASI